MTAAATPPIRIVDFSTHLSGPLASHLLIGLGAEVIKIEHPRIGDGNRGNLPLIDDLGSFHFALNSGAKSLTVNLKSPEWPAIAAACADWADAVIVGARPSDARKRGMDFETLSAANDKLIYVSLSGFGNEGPWTDLPAHGQTMDAFAGLVPTVKEEGALQPQTRPLWRTAGTSLGGVFAAMGVLAALHRRENGLDEPQYLSVSIWGTAMWWNWRDTTMLANTGDYWTDYSDLGSRYSLYSTADDRVVLIAVSERRFWETIVDLLELPAEWRERGDWALSGMDHGSGEAHQDERRLLAEKIGEKTMDEWTPILTEAEVPFAPLLTIEEALNSEHAKVNGVMRETTLDGKTYQVPSVPIRFAADEASVENPGPVAPPPGLGADNDEILDELGVNAPAS
jgi:crotonobetainyl-CoA:carnitine CoA-transferase CaiB-like acyl-CoA transferase